MLQILPCLLEGFLNIYLKHAILQTDHLKFEAKHLLLTKTHLILQTNSSLSCCANSSLLANLAMKYSAILCSLYQFLLTIMFVAYLTKPCGLFSAGKGGLSNGGVSGDASVGRFQAGLLSLGSMHAHFGHVNQAMQVHLHMAIPTIKIFCHLLT